MSTILIVVGLVVVFVVVVLLVLYVGPGRTGGRRGLRRRFGPEYDRTVARHDGDIQTAEHELAQRVRRHGHLRPRPVPDEARRQYTAEWTRLQERFVESPAEAVRAAEQLLARVAEDRGFPPASRYDEQLDALSVHHASEVDDYRRIHAAAEPGGGAGTENLREALVGARGLFERLVGAPSDGAPTHRTAHRQAGRRNLMTKPGGSGVR